MFYYTEWTKHSHNLARIWRCHQIISIFTNRLISKHQSSCYFNNSTMLIEVFNVERIYDDHTVGNIADFCTIDFPRFSWHEKSILNCIAQNNLWQFIILAYNIIIPHKIVNNLTSFINETTVILTAIKHIDIKN